MTSASGDPAGEQHVKERMSVFTRFVVSGYAEGRTIRALAEEAKRPYARVRAALLAEGVRLRKPGYRTQSAVLALGDARTRREQLSDELQSARLASGLTGRRAAELVGFSQSKVSKIETGRLLPKVADVKRLVDAYKMPAEWRLRTLALAKRVVRDAGHKRAVLHRGVARRQVEVARAGREAEVVRVFALSAVPPQALTGVPPGRRLVVVVPEGALRSAAGQWQRLREVSQAPNVEIGVIPWFTPVRLPDAGFQVFDDRMAVAELLAGNVVITDYDDVRGHLDRFEVLRSHAVIGDRMREVLDIVQEDCERHHEP